MPGRGLRTERHPRLLAQLSAEEVEALDDPATEATADSSRGARFAAAEGRVAASRTRRLSVITLAAAAAVLAVAVVVGIWPGIGGARWRRRADGRCGDHEQDGADADQRRHHHVEFRLGHADRHGLHLRRLREPRSGGAAEPWDGRDRSRRIFKPDRDVGRARTEPPPLPSGSTTLQKDQIKSVQLVDTDTKTVLLQTDL